MTHRQTDQGFLVPTLLRTGRPGGQGGDNDEDAVQDRHEGRSAGLAIQNMEELNPLRKRSSLGPADDFSAPA